MFKNFFSENLLLHFQTLNVILFGVINFNGVGIPDFSASPSSSNLVYQKAIKAGLMLSAHETVRRFAGGLIATGLRKQGG